MFLRRKAQSTAEYAITIGLVIAVVAGIMQVTLKGGMRKKHKEAMSYLLDAGHDIADYKDLEEKPIDIYTQDYRQTEIDAGSYVDEYLMEKGGGEKRYQQRTTESTSYSAEMLDAVEQPGAE